MRVWFCLPLLVLTACAPEPQPRQYVIPKATPTPGVSPKATMNATPALVAQTSGFASPTYPATPANWKAKDLGAMRKGSWAVGPEGAEADLAVTVFPGDVGGRLANINRWRGQLGLPHATAEVYAVKNPAKVGRLQGERIDLRSNDGATATCAILIEHQEATWFFKLTGPTTTVDSAIPELMNFLGATELP